MQEEVYPELSDAIEWKKIQRRNIGFVYAYNTGCDVLATVDDDNIPYDNWGKIELGTQKVKEFWTNDLVFDPVGIFYPHLWHRGYPLELVKKRISSTMYYETTQCFAEVDIQANLWNGDPDIDAICRMMSPGKYTFEFDENYTSKRISPFNSQNTIISRDVVPHYMCIPYIGRMDDIWGVIRSSLWTQGYVLPELQFIKIETITM